MENCKVCNEQVAKTYDGRCISCICVEARQDEIKRTDEENELEYEMNTPIGDRLPFMLGFGQGNFSCRDIFDPEYIKEHLRLQEEWIEEYWDKWEPSIMGVLHKYEQEIRTRQYDFMLMANYASYGALALVENCNGIAIVQSNIELITQEEHKRRHGITD